MSEVTPTPEELVEEISLTVDDATVIPMPIDPTLSNQGEAADAKATGDAIAAAVAGLSVNTKTPVNNAITVYGTDIYVSNATGAQTITAALEATASTNASQIMYDTVNLVSVKDAIDGIKTEIDTELTSAQIDKIFDEVFEEDE